MPDAFACLSTDRATALTHDSHPALLDGGWACVNADLGSMAGADFVEGSRDVADGPPEVTLHGVDPDTADLTGYTANELRALAWRELQRPAGYRTSALDKLRTEVESR